MRALRRAASSLLTFRLPLTLAGALVAITWSHPDGYAQPASQVVVARVGSRTITAGELERKLAAVPGFQLRTLGNTPEEVRRAFLDRVLIRDAVFAEGAMAEVLSERADVQDRIRAVLRSAVLAQVKYEIASGTPISDEDVRKYYDENRSRFNSPARLALWRILLDKREEAQQVLDEAKKDLSPKRWTELARERSVDKATGMRGGNLGFVAPDGTTGEPGVRVDPALFQAAAGVKDAELCPAPVREGERWAVVWRRQGMRAIERPIESEAPSIRQILAHARTEERVKELVEKLRKERLTQMQPELVDMLEITSSGELQTTRRPGSLSSSRRPSAAAPAPVQGPSGVR